MLEVIYYIDSTNKIKERNHVSTPKLKTTISIDSAS